MKKNTYRSLSSFAAAMILAALVLSGCVRQVAPPVPPTTEATTMLEEILTSTPIPLPTETPVPPTPTETQAPTDTPAPTSTEVAVTPTNTPEPTASADEEGTPAPTGSATPRPTLTGVEIDPDQEFTGAHHVDEMETVSLWTDQSGTLPDSQYLKLEMADSVMTVTGKQAQWDTWWVSGFTLTNFYIEMDVNTGDCNPDDAYGMILRASQSGQPTRGYLIAFTCDGKVYAKRLDSVTPYVATTILLPTATDLIYAGQDQDNTIGVLFDGTSISLYPNRRYFTTIEDTTYPWGRFGIYVQAGEEGNFTFTISEIRSWGVQ